MVYVTLIYVTAGVQSKDKLGKFSGEMSNNEIIRDLFYGKVESVIDALLNRDNYDTSNLNAQIAYRFPELSLGDGCTNTSHDHDDDVNIYHADDHHIDSNQSQRIGMYVCTVILSIQHFSDDYLSSRVVYLSSLSSTSSSLSSSLSS